MDHFESIVATLLEAEGYWVRRSFKVNVSKEEKRQIGKHSIPRPEIDLLALKFSPNEVLALEAMAKAPPDPSQEHRTPFPRQSPSR